MDTLTPEQVQNWRRIIAMQLESVSPGAGLYAMIMPESEVIDFWQSVKNTLEQFPKPNIIGKVIKPINKIKCNHENSITGQCGTYCLDCEKYI